MMRIRFVIPGIPLALRALLFAACELGGLYVQFFVAPDPLSMEFFLGLGILLCGALLLAAGNYRNKPQDLGFEDWQPVTANEYVRIKNNLLATQKISLPFYFNKAFGSMLVIGCIILMFICTMAEAFSLIPLILDAGIILSPLFLSGLVSLWMPSVIKLKLPCFDAIFAQVPAGEKNYILTPYLRFDKDKEGRKIPEDIRFMLEPRRKPGDFMGVQFQAAVNNGPNGAVPYLYAVFLCKGRGTTYDLLTRQNYGGFIHEPGGDDQYGFIVLRQETSGGGYHTKPQDCVALYKQIMNILTGFPAA
jgi:hypothetical protein